MFVYRKSDESCCIIASEPYRDSINAHGKKEIEYTDTAINESAKLIVEGVRSLIPPGRFLERQHGLDTEWKEMSEETSVAVTKHFLSDILMKGSSSSLNNEAVKVVPNDNDVIKSMKDHPGTVKYNDLLKLYIELDNAGKYAAAIVKKSSDELISMNPPARMLKVVRGRFVEGREAMYKNLIL